MRRLILLALVLFGLYCLGLGVAQEPPRYVKQASRTGTVLATLRAFGQPTFEGKWYYIGPFDNSNGRGFTTKYPPELGFDPTATYPGKGDRPVGWVEFAAMKPGRVVDLRKPKQNNNDSVCYLYHEFEVKEATELPLSLGSDDGIIVWHNGKEVLAADEQRAAAPDQESVTLKLTPGKNRLLIKVTNFGGEWAVYLMPDLPKSIPANIRDALAKDFPKPNAGPSSNLVTAEARYYRMETVPLPTDCVLEVGGLGFRPDGKLVACTRRGEVWLFDHITADDLNQTQASLFAKGLHEALGLLVEDNNTLLVTQRPELTRLLDRDGDGVADEFVTVCDRYGVSGDYHEFAFGPARDRDGNLFLTLNVGFGGGHQSKAPWRGWCVKITPKGDLIPYAAGLRSPNGVNFSPDGHLFYADNQGEWVATNKLHEIRQGEFYGHQASLRWVEQSPFAGKLTPKVPSGMLYDGQKGTERAGYPNHVPPCIWFPYGRMGQSASEPRWDTTAGKFGPFAGQCFVGDQTKSMVMRVALEQVGGRHQGACFPFRSGFQCGINRLVFGPDHRLYAGQTNRGWGSVGGKAYGLQRLTWTGELPFEMHHVHLTKDGFTIAFTKPVDPAKAADPNSYNLRSYTYHYWPKYGSPEVDSRAEKLAAVEVAPDRKSVRLTVPGLRVGRVYEIIATGVTDTDGAKLLHPEAWYTLNQLRDG